MDEKQDGERRKVLGEMWDEAKLVAQAQIVAAQTMGFSYGGQVLGGLISSATLAQVAFSQVDKRVFVHYAELVWEGVEVAHQGAVKEQGEAQAEQAKAVPAKPLTLTEQAHVQQMLADALSKPEEGLGRA